MGIVKSYVFGAIFVFAMGPGPVPVSANSVPVPAPSAVAGERLAAPAGQYAQDGAILQQAAVVAPGSQARVVRVQGRPLSLSLMRADLTGLAVLSVPERSVISSLPDIEPEEFRSLVAAESGCRPVGRVQVVDSRSGTVALATGLACS